jgi:hypothetical protein
MDDGNILAPHHIMLEIISYLRLHESKFGYVAKLINLQKGGFLLGKCEDADTAQAYFEDIVEVGVPPHLIRVHYDNEHSC